MSQPPPNSRLLFSEQQIERAIDRLAVRMNLELQNEEAVFVSVLRGALPFTWDLLRRMNIDVELEFIRVERYHGTDAGEPKIIGTDPPSFGDKTVVIVDDVLDGGATLKILQERFQERSRRLLTAVLVKKQTTCERDVEAEYIGLSAPDLFLVGRGMDYNGKYRDLPEIYALEM